MIQTGESLGKYEIQKFVGRGRFAKVYRAMDTVLDDVVAIKEIEIDSGKEEDAKKTLREAILMRSLKNQHILSIWDAMIQDEFVYLIMEYASGGTLRDRLKLEGSLPEEDVIDITKQICDGVVYAHDRDIMHRDLKPENVFFDQGMAKIGDFGVARVIQGTSGTATRGIGTYMHMAPEQFRKGYDKRVDIWAIGVLIYEMAVGRPPYEGEEQQIIFSIAFDPSPVEIPSSVPNKLKPVIAKALEKDPDNRYHTVDEIMEVLTTSKRVYVMPDDEPEVAEEPPKEITGKDGAPMVLIPAGEFEMGSNNDYDAEKPVHTVYTDAFYMDRYQVTKMQYAKFLNDYGKKEDDDGNELIYTSIKYCMIEKSGSKYRPKSGYESHPVVEVSWYGARAYAEFYGKRLPTEAEWEKAARGGLEGKKYPWGDESPKGRASYGGDWNVQGMKKTLKPVGSFEPNGYGLYDMAGNVFEWCADSYDSDYYSNSPRENPSGPASGGRRVCRGGSWFDFPCYIRVADRDGYDPSLTYNYLGFRCVVSSPVSSFK